MAEIISNLRKRTVKICLIKGHLQTKHYRETDLTLEQVKDQASKVWFPGWTITEIAEMQPSIVYATNTRLVDDNFKVGID